MFYVYVYEYSMYISQIHVWLCNIWYNHEPVFLLCGLGKKKLKKPKKTNFALLVSLDRFSLYLFSFFAGKCCLWCQSQAQDFCSCCTFQPGTENWRNVNSISRWNDTNSTTERGESVDLKKNPKKQNYCPVSWGYRIYWLLLCRGVKILGVSSWCNG